MSSLIATPAAFVVYVLVATITPGPNNLMLLAVGLTKGHAAALRTALGVATGWGFQVLLCGLGIGAAIKAVPGLAAGIEVLGLLYLCYLAWKLWKAADLGSAAPMLGYRGAFLFQWVNPKALSTSLTTAGLFIVSPKVGSTFASAFAVAIGSMLICIPSTATWALLGVTFRTRLEKPGAAKRFNRLAAMLLIGMVIWLALASR